MFLPCHSFILQKRQQPFWSDNILLLFSGKGSSSQDDLSYFSNLFLRLVSIPFAIASFFTSGLTFDHPFTVCVKGRPFSFWLTRSLMSALFCDVEKDFEHTLEQNLPDPYFTSIS